MKVNFTASNFIQLFFEFVDRINERPEMLVADYDMVFSNILVDGDTWKLLDYEWTYEKQIPIKELAFRALYCYLLEDESRNKFNFDLILKGLDITADEADGYREREMRFQKTVTGRRMSMPQLRELIGGAIIVPQKSLLSKAEGSEKKRVQVYYDEGEGFMESNSFSEIITIFNFVIRLCCAKSFFYIDRAAGGDCHYCNSCGNADVVFKRGTTARLDGRVSEQLAAAGGRLFVLCR